jgi:hypothetical protein
MGPTKRRALRVIPGGRSSRDGGGAVSIVVATDDRAPFETDAVVLEDDTFAVLGADLEFHETDEHPIRIWTQVHEMEETDPGTVVVQEGKPLRLLAVVHDLARDPSWKEEWISAALTELLVVVRERRLRALGIEPLGCVYGKFAAKRFVELLREALACSRPASLERVWVISPPELVESLSASVGRG